MGRSRRRRRPRSPTRRSRRRRGVPRVRRGEPPASTCPPTVPNRATSPRKPRDSGLSTAFSAPFERSRAKNGAKSRNSATTSASQPSHSRTRRPPARSRGSAFSTARDVPPHAVFTARRGLPGGPTDRSRCTIAGSSWDQRGPCRESTSRVLRPTSLRPMRWLPGGSDQVDQIPGPFPNPVGPPTSAPRPARRCTGAGTPVMTVRRTGREGRKPAPPNRSRCGLPVPQQAGRQHPRPPTTLAAKIRQNETTDRPGSAPPVAQTTWAARQLSSWRTPAWQSRCAGQRRGDRAPRGENPWRAGQAERVA